LFGIDLGVHPLNTFRLFFRNRPSGFPPERLQHEPPAHADLSMDSPDRQLNPGGLGGLPPSQHMLVDAIHQRAVQIKEKGYGIKIVRSGHAC